MGFRAQVRARRRAVGMTQAELAEAAGISERSVSDLERGLRTRIYPATARRLAAALRVPEQQLSAFLTDAAGTARAEAVPVEPIAALTRSRLPVTRSRLIGREHELTTVLELVRDPDTRLLSVVGAGGVGKTRLALALAEQLEPELPSAIHFVNLSAVAEAAQVLSLVADGVGPRLTPDPLDALRLRLGDARALIILDTFEHVLEAASAIAELVRACAGVHIVVTSRSALNLRDEVVVRLDPLRVAVRGSNLPPAAELFLERARSAAPGLPLDTSTRSAAVLIATRLGGLPLAIELAAARAQHMSLAELVESLAAPLEPLSRGRRDGPDRHRTMRRAFDWSYALLDDSAQRQLRALSVLRGGFDVDAAAAVAGPGWTDHHSRVVDALSSLVDASLIVFEPGAAPHGRYRILDVVRDYARELAAERGEIAEFARRHAEHFAAVAERGEPHLRGGGQHVWHQRLLADESNLRAALEWGFEHRESEVALRLVAALWMFWRWIGLFAEGKRLLEQALAIPGGSAGVRLRALWGAGWLAYHDGDYQQAAAAGAEILRLATDSDTASRRNGFTLVGIAALAEERTGAAIDNAREALELAESTGSGWLVATSLLNLGTALLASGDAAGAVSKFEPALAHYRSLGDSHFAARTLIQLGYCSLEAGDPAGATTRIRDAIQISRELGDRWGIAEGLKAASVLCANTDPERAAMLAGAARTVRAEIAMHAHPPDDRFNRRYLDAARSAIGGERYEAAWQRGATASLEAMVEAAATA
ncbi:MAG TPA: tetratricopeptide repeat protein [Candidatus Dormibacteraeota bacterium]